MRTNNEYSDYADAKADLNMSESTFFSHSGSLGQSFAIKYVTYICSNTIETGYYSYILREPDTFGILPPLITRGTTVVTFRTLPS